MDMIRKREQLAVLTLATAIVGLVFVTTIAAAPLTVTQRTFSNQVGYVEDNVCDIMCKSCSILASQILLQFPMQESVSLTVQTHRSIHARASKSALDCSSQL